jgi:hypothetical protein
MVAGKAGKKDATKNAVIHAQVHLGEPKDIGGFGIAVDIKVEGVEDDALIQAAHEVGSSRLAAATMSITFFSSRIALIAVH